MTYRILTSGDVPSYIRGRACLRDRLGQGPATVEEIGDGNLNHVFRISAEGAGSLVLKQALPWVRVIGPTWPLPATRSRHEASVLRAHAAMAPGLVPAIFDTDPEMNVITMEDLSDHAVWRTLLNQGNWIDGVGQRLGGYVARVFVGSSPLGIDESRLRSSAASHLNIDLCKISEDLIFADPYHDNVRNTIDGENRNMLDKLWANPEVIGAANELRFRFATRAEALIHGDLHTGSVFVRETKDGGPSVRVFDHEFGFYGPIAFDLGLLVGNLCHATMRASALGRRKLADRLLRDIHDSWRTFSYVLEAHERRSAVPYGRQFLNSRIAEIETETVGYAGAEILRRAIGLAKTSDLTTLEPPVRARVQGTLIETAGSLLSAWKDGTIRMLTDTVRERAGDLHPL